MNTIFSWFDYINRDPSIFVGSIVIILIMYGIYKFIKYTEKEESKCPACRQPYAKQIGTQQKLGSATGYRTRPVVNYQYDSKGQVVGTEQRDQQFRVLTETWRQHYSCKFCIHSWHSDETITTENYNE